ncbi:MAG: 2-oxo acid dehydrogenase subunit E2 [Acidobacteria bacterium]|nr:2-oxo acid dehydrogenase subunit E2 [Acidobacteriota bacterium]
MATEIVDSGTVVKVLVAPGDTVTEDQPLVELETEKASVDVPASASGTVKDIRVKEGETIKVGQVILVLEEAAETRERKEARPEAEIEPEKPEEKKEEPPPKPRAEREARPEQKEERTREAPPHREKVVSIRKEERRRLAEAELEPVPAAPSVRRMARELGIDVNEVTGTGPDGRISEDDLRNYARSIILNATGKAAAPAAILPDFSRWGEIERRPMTSVRRKTAQHLQDAWTSIPHVTHFDSADITELEQLRERFSPKVEQAGGKLTITAIAIKVAAEALNVFPQFNVSLDASREEIVYKKYCHIGVAVDTDRGLLVPVIRDVDQKNILDLSIELTQLAEKARNKKLALEEMEGSTFTVTNLGGIGGASFTPIINSPEAAILGISRARQEPVLKNGEFKPRLMLPLALSFDHRLIDGADAARFLRWVAVAFEQPFLLALEG